MFAWLKKTVEGSETTAGRLFDVLVQVLIVLSLITFSVETLPQLPEEIRRWLRNFEFLTVVLFTLEYLMRLIVADRQKPFRL